MIEIKVNYPSKKAEKNNYPYIGVKEFIYVLFTKPREGFVIAIDEDFCEIDMSIPEDDESYSESYSIGDYRKTWSEKYFKKIEGELILKNK